MIFKYKAILKSIDKRISINDILIIIDYSKNYLLEHRFKIKQSLIFACVEIIFNQINFLKIHFLLNIKL